MSCSVHYIGDIIVVFLRKRASFLKIESPVSSPGKGPVWVPVNTRTTYALTPKPLSEESGNETYAAIRIWEREYESVDEFLEVRECQGIPMPAVSV